MNKPTLIYSHFHGRRTGVTRSVEAVLPLLKQQSSLYLFGWGIDAPVTRLSLWGMIGLLIRHAYRRQRVIWHAHRNIEMLTALLFRLFFPGLKLVYTRHSATPPSWWTRWLFRRADSAVALTEPRAFPCDYVVIPHGVDTQRYIPKPRESESSGTIGIIGRVRHSKGQHVAVEAAIPLLQQHRDWRLEILGRIKASEQSYAEAMQQAIEVGGVSAQCRFIDEVDDPIPYYQSYDILLVPSFSEGFSMVTLEAMACGCAVIATEHVGGHDSLIRSGENGLLVAAGEVASLQAALAQLMEDAEQRRRFSVAARDTVVTAWSVEREVEALGKLYHSLSVVNR